MLYVKTQTQKTRQEWKRRGELTKRGENRREKKRDTLR